MIWCSCNCLSDKDVRDRCRTVYPLTVAKIMKEIGAEPKCGLCIKTIVNILKEERNDKR